MTPSRPLAAPTSDADALAAAEVVLHRYRALGWRELAASWAVRVADLQRRVDRGRR